MAITTEGLQKVSTVTKWLSVGTAALGPGVSSSLLGGGGAVAALDVAEYLPHALAHADFGPLWALGGTRTFDSVPFVNPTGPIVVEPHTQFHAYTAQQGLDLALGEVTLLLLATAGVTKLASMAGRRMSQGRSGY